MKMLWLVLVIVIAGCASAPHPILICVPGHYLRDDGRALQTVNCYPAQGDRVEALER